MRKRAACGVRLSVQRSLFRCIQGDIPISDLLLIGAIVLPLLFFLILYSEQIITWFNLRFIDVINEDSLSSFGR